jgi:hypothetical protein
MFEPPCPDLEGPAAGIFPDIRALWHWRDERRNTRARYDEISKSDRRVRAGCGNSSKRAQWLCVRNCAETKG